MVLSKHAHQRQNQRGISNLIISTILSIVPPQRSHSNALKYQTKKKNIYEEIKNIKKGIKMVRKRKKQGKISPKKAEELYTEYKKQIQLLDKVKHKTIITGLNQTIITVIS